MIHVPVNTRDVPRNNGIRQQAETMSQWQPSASIETLRQRARLLQAIRDFFQQRQVLEVETPALSAATVTDVHLHSIRTDADNYYLQTSPEFHMKRLLAAGSGAIYQICKAFRGAEQGSRHNPEFTMLEWYQPGYRLADLSAEVLALIEVCLTPHRAMPDIYHYSYQQLFQEYTGIDPFNTSVDSLCEYATQHITVAAPFTRNDSLDNWLDFILSQAIEPQFPKASIVVVDGYPSSQSMLAKTSERDGIEVAERFEIYIDGIEIANGYHELQDAAELQRRMQQHLQYRRQRTLAAVVYDQHLLEAMQAGLPQCSGVALGVDRLLLTALPTVSSLQEVLAFDFRRA